MNLAMLFDYADPMFDGCYGSTIRDVIFGTGVLQNANRHMTIRCGEVRIDLRTGSEKQYRQLADEVFSLSKWSRFEKDRVRTAYASNSVYAWVIENVTKEISLHLDTALLRVGAYIGTHTVDYSNSAHFRRYRSSMTQYCRIQGDTCTLLIAKRLGQEPNVVELSDVQKAGFARVIWEDSGAQDSEFDDFDTHKHFVKVAIIRDLLAQVLPGRDYDAEELVMMLHDVRPELFSVLESIVRASLRSRRGASTEDVYLWVSSYIQKLAVALSLTDCVTELSHDRDKSEAS